MASLFTPSKKRPRYSMPVHATTDPSLNAPSTYVSQTLPRNHNSSHHSSALSTPLPFPSLPSASFSSPSPLPPPSPSPSSSPSLSLTEGTSTSLAVTSLLTQRAERHLSSTLLSHSHALSQQHDEALSSLRYHHQQDRLAWRAEQLEAERRLRGELAEANHRAQQLEADAESARIRDDDDRRDRDRREREARERIDELQLKLQFLATLEQKRRTDAELDDDRRRDERRKAEEDREAERRERAETAAELTALREREKKWKDRGEEEKRLLESRLDVLTRQLRDKDDDLQRALQHVADLERDARHRADEDRRAADEERKRRERDEELQTVQATVAARLEEAAETDRRYRQLVEELREARAQHLNATLLAEQLRGAEGKVRRLEADLERAQQAAVEAERQRGKDHDLVQQAAHVLHCPPTLDALHAAIRAQQTANAAFTADLTASRERLSATEAALAAKDAQLTAAIARADGLEDEVARGRQRLTVMAVEVEGLKRLLATYDQEDSAGGHGASQRHRVADLEARLDAAQRELTRTQDEVRGVRGEVARVKKEREMAEVELDRLRQAAGDDLAGLKVLHMKSNPDTNAQVKRRDEAIARLEEEVERLRERLHMTEGAQVKGALVPVTPSMSMSPISHVVTPFTSASQPASATAPAELVERLRQLEGEVQAAAGALAEQKAADVKRYDRLKSVFAERVREFREGCYRLTGYKVEVLSGQWRLKPMYAEMETDVVVFSREEGTGRFSLIETELVKRMGEEVMGVLTQWQSIPAFLSTITLELVSRQTRV